MIVTRTEHTQVYPLKEAKERAIEAYKQACERAATEEAARAERRATEQVEMLLRRLQEILCLDVTESDLDYDEAGPYFDLDGWRIAAGRIPQRPRDLWFWQNCPDCDGIVHRWVDDQFAFGQLLLNPPVHEVHFFEDDSTHPNAPKPEPFTPVEPPPPPPTAAEQLETIVRQIVQDELGRNRLL